MREGQGNVIVVREMNKGGSKLLNNSLRVINTVAIELNTCLP